VEDETQGALLGALADGDLLGLRLAAQVMTHKAELTARSRVAGYFGRLEAAVGAELASRLTGIRAIATTSNLGLDDAAEEEDRRLVDEYLGLLGANEQLSPELREVCRRLRAGNQQSSDRP